MNSIPKKTALELFNEFKACFDSTTDDGQILFVFDSLLDQNEIYANTECERDQYESLAHFFLSFFNAIRVDFNDFVRRIAEYSDSVIV